MPQWLPPVLTLLSTFAEFVGAILITRSVNAPKEFGGEMTGRRPDGTGFTYRMAYVLDPCQLRWGIGLVIGGFVPQLAVALWNVVCALR